MDEFFKNPVTRILMSLMPFNLGKWQYVPKEMRNMLSLFVQFTSLAIVILGIANSVSQVSTGEVLQFAHFWISTLISCLIFGFIANMIVNLVPIFNSATRSWFAIDTFHVVEQILNVPQQESNEYFFVEECLYFNSLALYELLKRKCREIYVFDSTLDPELDLKELNETLKRAAKEFIIEPLPTLIVAGDEEKEVKRRKMMKDFNNLAASTSTTNNASTTSLPPPLVATSAPFRNVFYPRQGFLKFTVKYCNKSPLPPILVNNGGDENNMLPPVVNEATIWYAKSVLVDNIEWHIGRQVLQKPFPWHPSHEQVLTQETLQAYGTLGKVVAERVCQSKLAK